MFGLDSLLSKMPVVGGLFDSSGDNAEEMYLKALQGYQNLAVPDEAYQNYNPEAYQYGGDFNPELAAYQQISEDPRLLSDQSGHLNALKQLAAQGFSPEDEAVFAQAKSQSAQQARGQNEAVMHNMAARGTAGSGMELLSREMAGQQGAERARASMMEQAAASARQKALYEQAYGSELSGQRSANEKVASQNADIINKFNQLNTGARNTATYNNLQNRQSVSNTNTGARNQAQLQNQQGQRQQVQQNYGNQLSRLSGLAGQYQNVGKMYDAEGAANAEKRKGIGAAVGSMFGPVGAAAGGALGNLF